ncbi:NAD(P)-binding protein [Marasmius fiardii PR-910]|nr:NAD(P)-binding protein [Marasmius fiardii PR-910]
MSIDKDTQHKPIALQFGAGNIGRGFIGAVLSKAGLRVVFADVQEKIIKALNEEHKYNVHILGDEEESKIETIEDVEAINSMDMKAIEEIAKQPLTIVTTAVGPGVLPRLGKAMAVIIRTRQANNMSPINFVACENLQNASGKLRDAVYNELSDEEKKYADENIGFAVCSVDRIVPPFDPDSGSILDVGVEPFYEWNVDAKSLKKTDPHCDIEGMNTVNNLDAYVQRKLFTLNCGHAITAFLGALPRGVPSAASSQSKLRSMSTNSFGSGASTPAVPSHPTILSAISTPSINDVVTRALHETGQALIRKHGFTQAEHDKYTKAILDRFHNPNMHDEVARVGREPLRKLKKGDRLLGPIELCREFGLDRDGLLVGVASALLFHPKKSTRRKSSAAVSGASSRRASAAGSRKGSFGGSALSPLAQLRSSLQAVRLEQSKEKEKEESAIVEDDYYEYEYEDEPADPQAQEVSEMIAEKGLVPVITELTGWKEDDGDVGKIVWAYETLRMEGIEAVSKAMQKGLKN